MKKKSLMFVGFVMYVLFGVYLINSAFNYYLGSFEVLIEFEKWIFVISGILLIWGGVNFFRIGWRKAKIAKAKKE